MLNPLEMNFYGTRNEGSFANPEVISEPNETTNTLNQLNKSNSSEAGEILNQDSSSNQNFKSDGIGKWIGPDKGKRCNTDPYPNISHSRKYPCKDKGLPDPLQELFTPLKCCLCNCTMGSIATAKDHYEGKKHKTNIKKWLLEHPQYCVETSDNNLGISTKILDPGKLYCKYCDVMLSSEQQAESHYLGRKHQNVINSGIPKNAYFNPVKGQWERLSKGRVESRFGIGSAFLEKDVVGEAIPVTKKLFCEICQVACPSEITFSEHLAGAKHKKKMALVNTSESTFATKDNILEEVIKTDLKTPSTSDLSVYRTPSGKYYCHACNVTVNSPIQFTQHSESRKHRNKTILTVATYSPKQ